MKAMSHPVAGLALCWLALLVCVPAPTAAADDAPLIPVHSVNLATPPVASDLAALVSNIAPLPQQVIMRRRIAQATFCLPQNVLGTLFYGLLQLTGSVVRTAELNEVKVIVSTAPFGVSLGKYIFIHTSLQTENVIRHEYGHTLQGYKHGPFYLLFEGVVSFVQAALSMISPSFADGYYERWPEDEANELGGVT